MQKLWFCKAEMLAIQQCSIKHVFKMSTFLNNGASLNIVSLSIIVFHDRMDESDQRFLKHSLCNFNKPIDKNNTLRTFLTILPSYC